MAKTEKSKENIAISLTVAIKEFGNKPKEAREKLWKILTEKGYTKPKKSKSGIKTSLRKGISNADLETQKEIQTLLKKKKCIE